MATEEEEDQYHRMPRGVPTLTYARLLDPTQAGKGIERLDDLEVEGDFVTVKEPGEPLSRFPAAHVFPKGMTDQEFCEHTIGQDAGADMGASLNPIAACVEDATSAVIMLVGSKLTKKWQFLKRIFLPFVANELFACLADKEDQGAMVYQYEVVLKSFEIQDEVITDLLRPTTRGLNISVSPESGVVIQGLQREKVSTEQMLRQLFIDTCDNRSSHTLPLGASIDTSTTVWELSLHQKEGDHDIVLQNLSKLLIVDVPSVNPLCMTASDIRVLDGPSLHKSLFSFADVSRKLASPHLSALAPFRSSKLTHYLGEMLGGNSLVLTLGLLHPGEPAVSKKTLEILGNLTAARHYPISGKEMSEIVQGLLVKYRSMLLHVEDELNARKSFTQLNAEEKQSEFDKTAAEEANSASQDHVKRLEAQITSLQQALVESKSLCEEKSTDAAQIYEVLELMKAKYSTLLSELSSQNEKMIVIEKEKLEVAKALVELKLEHSKALDDAEKEKFELTSTVLALKTQSAENDEEIQMVKMELRDTNDKLTESQKWYEKEKEKAVSAQAQVEELRGQLEKLESRNVDISTELVNLLNTRDSLQRDLDKALKQQGELEQLIDAEGTDLTTLRSNNVELEKQLAESRKNKDDLADKLTEMKFEMERMQLEVERSKIDFEKNATQYLKDKDFVMQKEGRVAKTEIQQLQHDKEDLLMTIRREERLKRDAYRNLDKMKQSLSEMAKERDDARGESAALRDAYRKHLAEVLEGVEKDLQQREGKKPTFSGIATALAAATQLHPELLANASARSLAQSSQTGSEGEYNPASWKALIDSFTQNEKSLYAQIKELNQTNHEASVAMGELFGKYRQALDVIEDACPHNLPNDVIASEADLLEQIRKQDHSSNMKSSHADASHGNVTQLQKQLKLAEDNLLAEQVKSADMINSYRMKLQKTEKRLSEISNENKFLKERMDAFSASTSNGGDAELRSQLLEMMKKHDEEQRRKDVERDEAMTQLRDEYDKKHDAMMMNMYSKLEKQMKELNRADRKSGGHSNADLQKQLVSTKQQLRSLKDENEDLRKALRKYSDSNAGYSDNRNNITHLKKYIEKLEENADSALLYQLREVEKRCSALFSRNASLEQELESYKAYMREAFNRNKQHPHGTKKSNAKHHSPNEASKHAIKQRHDDVEDVSANRELLNKFVQLQKQARYDLQSSENNQELGRKYSVGSIATARSQSAGSQLASSKDIHFPKI